MSNDFNVDELVSDIHYALRKIELEEKWEAERRAEELKRKEEQRIFNQKSETAKKLVHADRASSTPESARRLELGAELMILFNKKQKLQKKNDIYERVFERIGMWLLYILWIGISLIVTALITGGNGDSLLILAGSIIIGIILIKKFGEKLFSKLFRIKSRILEIAKIERQSKEFKEELYRLLPQPEFKDFWRDDAFIYALCLKD